MQEKSKRHKSLQTQAAQGRNCWQQWVPWPNWKGLAQLTLGIKSTQGNHTRLGQSGLLLGSHQQEAFPGTRSGLQHRAHQPATPWPTTTPLPAGISGTADISQGSAVISFCLAWHCTHMGKRARTLSSTVTRAVGLPQDTNMQLNTSAAPDNMLGTSQGCTCCLWDCAEISNTLSPGSVCLVFSGYCMIRMLLWLAYSWLEGSWSKPTVHLEGCFFSKLSTHAISTGIAELQQLTALNGTPHRPRKLWHNLQFSMSSQPCTMSSPASHL